MKCLTRIAWSTALFLPLFSSGRAVPKYQPNSASFHSALLRGEIKQALAAYESQAQEAEEKAKSSISPQLYWVTSTDNYLHAANAARSSGQLQRAVVYGAKALETTEKAKNAARQLGAIHAMTNAYRALNNFDKARELTEKALIMVRRLPPTAYVDAGSRLHHEANLYSNLGLDYMRQGEFEQAIDAHSESVDLRQARLSYQTGLYRQWPPGWIYVESTRQNVIGELTRLGGAYREAGKLEEALRQHQAASNYIKEWGFKGSNEAELYIGLGEIFFRQKNFPRALESFNQALTIAENQGAPAAINAASRRIGDVLREVGKSAEAIPYYRDAIQQIELTRSLLQSEEYRQTFFEGAWVLISAWLKRS